MAGRRPSEIIELQAGGAGDPDGIRTATIAAAYFRAEHIKAVRRVLCARLGVATILWFVVATVTSLSGNTLFAGLLILAGGGAWPLALEWHADRSLVRVLENHQSL